MSGESRVSRRGTDDGSMGRKAAARQGRASGALWGVASLVLLLVVWQAGVTLFGVEAYVLPTPVEVGRELVVLLGSWTAWFNVGVTAFETLVGFAVGTALGMLVGYAVCHAPTLRLTIMPFLVFFQVAPKIALVPIFIIWFGLGMVSKVVVVVSMVFFPVALGMIEGLEAIPASMLDLMRVLGATRHQTLVKVELPCAAPSLLASLKVGIIQALIGATVSEWMSGQSGLGYLQTLGSSTFNTPLLMSGIVLTIVLGLVLYAALGVIERRLTSWKGGA